MANKINNPAPQSNFPLFSAKLLLLLAIIGALAAFGLYMSAEKQLRSTQSQLATAQKDLQQFKQDPNSVAQAESKDLINKVGRLIILPTNETPTIATVTDLSKLQDQPFFANAQVGDKVLIYTNAKKAVLYRPSENKIIELAPLNLGQQNANISANANTSASTGTAKTKK